MDLIKELLDLAEKWPRSFIVANIAVIIAVIIVVIKNVKFKITEEETIKETPGETVIGTEISFCLEPQFKVPKIFKDPTLEGNEDFASQEESADIVKDTPQIIRLAEQGDTKAQYRLGGIYFFGVGVGEDKAKAAEWFHKAAEQGYAEAQYSLGALYVAGLGVAQDYSKAKQLFREAAEQGYAEAQHNLDLMYDTGKGGPKDDAKAAKWYRKTTGQGIKRAKKRRLTFIVVITGGIIAVAADIAILADKFIPGSKIAEPPSWFREFVKGKEDFVSPEESADIVKDKSQIIRLARQGDTKAQYDLGVLYATGEGVPEDKVEAVRWFRLAARQGYADAQFNLGVMYDKGEGVSKDDVEVVRWYRMAAEQGYAEAQANLGAIYANGERVPKDYIQAYAWLNLAAEQGIEWAKKRKETIEAKMTPTEIAEAQKLSREYSKAYVPEHQSE